MPKRCSKKVYFISILIPLLTGGLSALLGMSGISRYHMLQKPPLSPPGFLFPVVWTILFILMGISSAWIYCSNDRNKRDALRIYAIQLAVNFFWTIFFFRLQFRLFSFFWILLLIALVTAMIRKFRRIYPPAGFLQIPYLLWLIFAAYLNLGFWYLNK